MVETGKSRVYIPRGLPFEVLIKLAEGPNTRHRLANAVFAERPNHFSWLSSDGVDRALERFVRRGLAERLEHTLPGFKSNAKPFQITERGREILEIARAGRADVS